MNEGEFYINGDSGYLTLVHEPCEGLVCFIDAGDTLDELNAKADKHCCSS
ncbi:hypothetical protein [Microbispora sp. NPDC049633]